MDIIYGQETWLYSHPGFVIDIYESKQCNRRDKPGGICAIFITIRTKKCNIWNVISTRPKGLKRVVSWNTGGLLETTNAQEAGNEFLKTTMLDPA